MKKIIPVLMILLIGLTGCQKNIKKNETETKPKTVELPVTENYSCVISQIQSKQGELQNVARYFGRVNYILKAKKTNVFLSSIVFTNDSIVLNFLVEGQTEKAIVGKDIDLGENLVLLDVWADVGKYAEGLADKYKELIVSGSYCDYSLIEIKAINSKNAQANLDYILPVLMSEGNDADLIEFNLSKQNKNIFFYLIKQSEREYILLNDENPIFNSKESK